MGGLVEAKAAVSYGLIRQCRLQELGEDEAGLVEHRTIEEPAQRGCWLPVHREGDAPVVLLHCLAHAHTGGDCGKRAHDREWTTGWKEFREGRNQG